VFCRCVFSLLEIAPFGAIQAIGLCVFTSPVQHGQALDERLFRALQLMRGKDKRHGATKKPKPSFPFLKLQPLVPVLVIKDLAHAVPLARALVAGGPQGIEITMNAGCAAKPFALMAE